MITEKITASIDITRLDLVKTLITLLEQYREDLPVPLLESLNELADCEECEKTLFSGMGRIVDVYCVIDDKITKEPIGLITANKILKRLTFLIKDKDRNPIIFGEELAVRYEYPKKFKIVINGITVLEWGE